MKVGSSFAITVASFALQGWRFTPAASAAEVPGDTLFLAEPRQNPDVSTPPLLARELARQALLIAARDGLGLHTRDALMREWDSAAGVPSGSAGVPLRIDIHRDGPDRIAVDVTHADPTAALVVHRNCRLFTENPTGSTCPRWSPPPSTPVKAKTSSS